jgi:hypothetical protein
MLLMVARSASGKFGDAGAVELDEFADDTELAQGLRYGEHEVGGCGAFAEFAGKFVADHLGHQHGDGLAEHGGFGLDAAYAPAEHAEAVDHCGVRVGADEGIGICVEFAVDFGGEDYAGEIFEIDLVADSHARRHGAEVAKGRLAPFEKRIALAVALELEERIGVVGAGGAEFVDLYGVVDDEFCGDEGIDAFRIAAQCLDGVAHCAQVDDGGDAGEVLHENTGGHVGDFATGLGLGIPAGEELDVSSGDIHAVFATEQILEQDFEAEGKLAQVEAARGKGGQSIDGVGPLA